MTKQDQSLWFATITCLGKTAFIVILVSITPFLRAAESQDRVDFRYSLPWWQTSICLPDDADKPLVGREGQLLFDFGGGGVRNFGICLQPEISGQEWQKQQTVSPRAPIVQTWMTAAGVEVLEEAFVVTPKSGKAEAPPRLVRLDGQERLRGWAKPARECAPVFTGVDVSWGTKPIDLQLTVPARSKITLAFGLCEGWHKEPGKRPLILSAEGADPKQVDPVADFGVRMPGIYWMTAQDKNGDGQIAIHISTPSGTADSNAIVNAVWAFDASVPTSEQLLKGELVHPAFASYPAGSMPERQVVTLVTLKNTTTSPAKIQPTLRIRSTSPARFDANSQRIAIGDGTTVAATMPIESCSSITNNHWLASLPVITLKPGASQQFAWVIDRHLRQPSAPVSERQATGLRDAARAWWEKSNLPFETIQVPDPGIQAMVESSIRNIWQAREIKSGKIAFHVGPTVYRGLWIVDGAFLLESAAILNRGRDARAGIEYTLSKQKPDGGFEVLKHFWKENGIVLWTVTRHALLTQDKEWLRTKWPALQRIVKNTQDLRTQASKDPNALDYRLLPAGFIDGGIAAGDRPEYSNVQWNLAGLKAAIAAAHWLGEEADAAAWQKEYDDFYAAYRKAAARDMLKDKYGNDYLPTMMANTGNYSPQKGQWTFCHAIYPGQVFAIDDPLARSQMAMLRATKVEGMVFDTGWMKDGLWTYFASFYGHATLWMGDGKEAAQVLYDYANHACPTRVWREEQKPVGKGNEEVGDMPHNWASAEFVRLTAHLLEIDRGTELHLLEGIPHTWLQAGMVTRLNEAATPFGPLTLNLEVARNGQSATLKIKPLSTSCTAVVVHLPNGGTQKMDPVKGGKINFPLGK